MQVLSWLLLFAWQPANAPAQPPQRQTTRSPHGALNIPCENCHTATGWRPIRANPEFDHNKTKYPLRGMHEKVSCTQCHVKPVFTDVGKNCEDCHTDVHQRKMGTNCAQCHTVQGWNIAVQQLKNHQNRFPLFGAHAAVQCEDCHKGAAVGQFQGLSTACITCHQADVNRTQTIGGGVPNPVQGNFPQNCDMCHTFDSWFGATFNHAGPPANFALLGAHATVACTACHTNGDYLKFKGAVSDPMDCGNSLCHLTTWQQTTNPKHSAAPNVFPSTSSACAGCHNMNSWLNAKFDHSTTGFPLANSHQLAPAGKVNACSDCHINDNYNLTIQPNDCGNSGCHLSTNYGGGWQGTNNPVHSAAGAAFAAANCANCHNTTMFLTATFDHSTTGWPLVGSHQLAPAGKVNLCSDCHVNNNYNFTSANTDCYGCHQAAWNSTPTFGGRVPNHITAGFPTSLCSQCHDTIVWTDSTFNHANTGFPLTNSHQIAPAGKVTGCDQCHNGNYTTLAIQPNDCGNSACHLTTYNTTNNPVHSSAGAPFAIGNCSTCHNTVTWTTATFDHSTTGWPLTGSHQLAPAGKVNLCSDCHVNNNYNFTSANTDCYGCHQAAWNSTPTFGGNVPNHITAAFPTSLCSTCHDTVLWTDGKFDHSTTGFPLQGPHRLPPRSTVTGAVGPMVNACTDCHIGGNYATGYPSTDCYSCHQTYFTNAQTYSATAPNHVAASYPTTCVSCHTTWMTTAWLGAAFNHTWFQIPHHGSVCADCHINSTNYTAFSCINACHTGVNSPHTNKQQTDSNHSGVSGYTYNATICVNCHKG